MQVKIKRLNKNLPLPKYHTAGASGFDLYVSTDTIIKPHEIAIVKNGIIIEIPIGFMLLIVSRSSTAYRRNLHSPHGIGIVDNDYCGETDELMTQIYNNTDEPISLKEGDRISQGVIVPCPSIEFIEVAEMVNNSRGGYGTTGGDFNN